MKKLISLVVSIAYLMSAAVVSFAGVEASYQVRMLFDLGFVKGTDNTLNEQSLELDRFANRVEQATMVIRLLGKEEKAAWQINSHPFGDVPVWASANIGWLYENYVVNGITDTYFGAEETATVKQFAAMLLRVLGYSDSDGDFYYDEAVSFALRVGLINEDIAYTGCLTRRNMFVMCSNALKSNMKNSRRKLINKLCDEGVVDNAIAQQYGLIKEFSVSDAFAGVPENLGNITVMTSYNWFKINFSNDIEEYGLRVFVRMLGNNEIREITGEGEVRLEKGQIRYPGGGRAGYISELSVIGLDTNEKYEFIVIKTSSEGTLYETTGKSRSACN